MKSQILFPLFAHTRLLQYGTIALLLLFCGFGNWLWGQGENSFCGTYHNVNTIPHGYQGELFMDRFGNQYTEDDLKNLASGAVQECNQGIFSLKFKGQFTLEERLTICGAFFRISNLIGSPGLSNIPVLIEKKEQDYSAVASEMYAAEDCGIVHSSVLNYLNGISSLFNPKPIAGFIYIRDKPITPSGVEFEWYIDPNPNDPSLDPVNTPPGTVDLLSAVTHEILHLLGIGSLITEDGTSVANGLFSEWDRFLYATEKEQFLLVQNGTPTCCNKHDFNAAQFNMPEDLSGNCSSTQDVVTFRYNNIDIVPVNDIGVVVNPANTSDEIQRKLSHIPIACSTSGEQYVMDAGLDPGEVRRTVTGSEVAVLCALGYSAGSNCTADCKVVSNNDNAYIYVPLGGSYPISILELLENDIYPIGYSFNIIENCENNNNQIKATQYANNIKVEGFQEGIWKFCYEIHGCDGKCDQATVTVIVAKTIPVTCQNQDCNLVCFGDFEDLLPIDNLYHQQIGAPLFQITSPPAPILDNSVDGAVDINRNSRMVRWARMDNSGTWEVVRIPLNQPFLPGCTYQFSLKTAAAAFGNLPNDPPPASPNPTLSIFGLTAPPCPFINEPVYSNFMSLSEICDPASGVKAVGLWSDNIFFDADEYAESQNKYYNLNLKSETFTVTWPAGNPPLTDLLIYGSHGTGGEGLYEYFLDDLYIINECDAHVSVEPQIISQCADAKSEINYTVTLTGANAAAVDIVLQLPNLTTLGLVNAPPSDFNTQGQATVTFPPNPSGGVVTLSRQFVFTTNTTLCPYPLNLPITATILGDACLNTLNSNGEVSLSLTKCAPSQTACFCSANQIYLGGECPGTTVNLSATALYNVNSPNLVVVTDACVVVEGTLIIDKNFDITNCDFYMSPGSKIELENGVILNVARTSLHGCTNMWRGVLVKSGAIFNSNGSAPGRNKISDAQYAIQAGNGSTIKLVSTDFDKNYVDVYVANNANVQNVTLANPGIADCTFTSSGDLFPLYQGQSPSPGNKPYAAFLLNKVAGFNFGSKVPNTVSNHRHGLIGNNSSFSVSNISMSNFEGNTAQKIGVKASNCSIAKIKDCKIDGYINGIITKGSNTEIEGTKFNVGFPSEISETAIIINSGTGKYTRIMGNFVERSARGIYIEFSYSNGTSSLENNTVSKFFVPAGSSTTKNGIEMGNVTSFIITDNHIGDGLTGDDHTGIYSDRCFNNSFTGNYAYGMKRGFYESGGGNNDFIDNVVQKYPHPTNADLPGEGFYVSSSKDNFCNNTLKNLTGDGLYFLGDCDPSTVRHSQIYGSQYGLRIFAANSSIGVQDNIKNNWYGPFSSGFGAFHEEAIKEEIELSQFKTQQDITPVWTTGAGNGPGVNWFDVIQSDPPPPFPISPCQDIPYSGRPGANDAITAEGGHDGPFGDAYNWTAQLNLFERIEADESVLSDNPVVEKFYEAAKNNDIGQFAGIREVVRRFHHLEPSLSAQLIDLSNQIVQESEDLDNLISQPNYSVFSAAQHQNNLRYQTALYLLAMDDIAQQQQAAIPVISMAVSNMTDAAVFQSNEKRIYQMYFGYELWKPEVVPPTIVTEAISQIANQCAIEGGTGVYLARMLANRYGLGQDWDDRLLCSVQERSTKNADLPVNWKVIPNPASEIVKISCSQPVSSDASITLFDIYGIIRYSGTLLLGQSMLSIPAGTFSSGIYYYKIDSEDKVTGSKGKLIIQH